MIKVTWKDILKFKITSPRDIKRLGNEYAPKDMYESKVIDSDKYNLLSDSEKAKYHGRLKEFLKRYSQGIKELEESRKFHGAMLNRLKSGKTNIPTFNRLSNAPPEIPKRKDKRRRKTKKKQRNYGMGSKGRGLIYGPARENASANWYRKRNMTPPPKPRKTKEERQRERRKKQEDRRISNLISDYFTIYQKKYNREPTLQEIKDEEGRPLTSFEEESYYKMKKR